MKNDVLLECHTVGRVDGHCEEGDVVTVRLHDENGCPIEVTGKILEILDTSEDWN